MIYDSQLAYDNASEAELDDYRESPEFAEFAEYVTIVLLRGHDWQNLSSGILMIDLRLAKGGYQLALEWVSARLTEKQFKEWISDY